MTTDPIEQPDTDYVPEHSSGKVQPIMTDRTYEQIRQLIELVIPAFTGAYIALANIWNWPAADKVAATGVAVTLLLTTLLKVARKVYNKSEAKYDGDLVLDKTDPDQKTLLIAPKVDPENLPKDSLFKVTKVDDAVG